MSNALLAQIRKRRESKVPVGKFTFLLRRPTDADMVDLAKRGAEYFEVASEFVIGWEGVTENDVIGGGGSDVLPFDSRLWREWCADRKDFWDPIGEAAVEAYNFHKKELEEDAKNSQPG